MTRPALWTGVMCGLLFAQDPSTSSQRLRDRLASTPVTVAREIHESLVSLYETSETSEGEGTEKLIPHLENLHALGNRLREFGKWDDRLRVIVERWRASAWLHAWGAWGALASRSPSSNDGPTLRRILKIYNLKIDEKGMSNSLQGLTELDISKKWPKVDGKPFLPSMANIIGEPTDDPADPKMWGIPRTLWALVNLRLDALGPGEMKQVGFGNWLSDLDTAITEIDQKEARPHRTKFKAIGEYVAFREAIADPEGLHLLVGALQHPKENDTPKEKHIRSLYDALAVQPAELGDARAWHSYLDVLKYTKNSRGLVEALRKSPEAPGRMEVQVDMAHLGAFLRWGKNSQVARLLQLEVAVTTRLARIQSDMQALVPRDTEAGLRKLRRELMECSGEGGFISASEKARLLADRVELNSRLDWLESTLASRGTGQEMPRKTFLGYSANVKAALNELKNLDRHDQTAERFEVAKGEYERSQLYYKARQVAKDISSQSTRIAEILERVTRLQIEHDNLAHTAAEFDALGMGQERQGRQLALEYAERLRDLAAGQVVALSEALDSALIMLDEAAKGIGDLCTKLADKAKEERNKSFLDGLCSFLGGLVGLLGDVLAPLTGGISKMIATGARIGLTVVAKGKLEPAEVLGALSKVSEKLDVSLPKMNLPKIELPFDPKKTFEVTSAIRNVEGYLRRGVELTNTGKNLLSQVSEGLKRSIRQGVPIQITPNENSLSITVALGQDPRIITGDLGSILKRMVETGWFDERLTGEAGALKGFIEGHLKPNPGSGGACETVKRELQQFVERAGGDEVTILRHVFKGELHLVPMEGDGVAVVTPAVAGNAEDLRKVDELFRKFIESTAVTTLRSTAEELDLVVRNASEKANKALASGNADEMDTTANNLKNEVAQLPEKLERLKAGIAAARVELWKRETETKIAGYSAKAAEYLATASQLRVQQGAKSVKISSLSMDAAMHARAKAFLESEGADIEERAAAAAVHEAFSRYRRAYCDFMNVDGREVRKNSLVDVLPRVVDDVAVDGLKGMILWLRTCGRQTQGLDARLTDLLTTGQPTLKGLHDQLKTEWDGMPKPQLGVLKWPGFDVKWEKDDKWRDHLPQDSLKNRTVIGVCKLKAGPPPKEISETTVGLNPGQDHYVFLDPDIVIKENKNITGKDIGYLLIPPFPNFVRHIGGKGVEGYNRMAAELPKATTVNDDNQEKERVDEMQKRAFSDDRMQVVGAYGEWTLLITAADESAMDCLRRLGNEKVRFKLSLVMFSVSGTSR